MKQKVIVYSLKDFEGNVSSSVVSDHTDNICVGGYDENDKYWQYDSYEGYWLADWIKSNKLPFQYSCVEVEFTPVFYRVK